MEEKNKLGFRGKIQNYIPGLRSYKIVSASLLPFLSSLLNNHLTNTWLFI